MSFLVWLFSEIAFILLKDRTVNWLRSHSNSQKNRFWVSPLHLKHCKKNHERYCRYKHLRHSYWRTWMGDHSRVNCGSCWYTNCSIPGAEKRPPPQQTTRKTTLTEAETTILKIINDDCILFRYTFHWRSVRAVVFLVSSLVILVVLVTSIAGYMQLTLHHNRHPHPHTHTWNLSAPLLYNRCYLYVQSHMRDKLAGDSMLLE